MFKTILVATDLSEPSDHVVGCLKALRGIGAERAVLLHCLGIRHLDELQHVLAPLAEPRLLAQKATLEKQGFEVIAEIAPGLPQFEIHRIAVERDCGLIVLGTRGQTMTDEIHLGGVASEVIHGAARPVLLVRVLIPLAQAGPRCEIACKEMLEHVLFPTDFSDNADHAFSHVVELARSGARRITLMHVQDKVRIAKHLEHRLEEFNRIDRERLERLAAKLQQADKAEVGLEIVYGAPVAEILRQARDSGASLIVMGSQGKGYISEVLLGSVSHNVARHAGMSVMLVPAVR